MSPTDVFAAIEAHPTLSLPELAVFLERSEDTLRPLVGRLLQRKHVRYSSPVGGLEPTPAGLAFYRLASPTLMPAPSCTPADVGNPGAGSGCGVALWQAAEAM